MESYSLYQLNEYIRRVIALNFREPLWIEAEISQAKNSRGNFYLELIEKDEEGDGIVAQTSAVIWYRNFKFIEKKLGDIVHDLVQDGTQVRLKCKIDYHERYGLKLVVEDIDPNYTYGKLELKRQEIILKLEEEGLNELNKGLILPTVIQRIAVISSSGAAGYQDFKKQLDNNPYDYTFKVDLYDSAVQGAKVSSDTTQAIDEIIKSKKGYHIVAIIRGGGSKLDLSGYDDYDIAKAVALSEIPFVIGIGHDIDSTVTDMVACVSLKTPTAVADFIIEKNMMYESRIESSSASLIRSAQATVKEQQQSLTLYKERMTLQIDRLLQEERSALDLIGHRINSEVELLLQRNKHVLEQATLKIDGVDPIRILHQGYSIIKKGDRSIITTKDLQKNDEVTIVLQDGTVESIITKA